MGLSARTRLFVLNLVLVFGSVLLTLALAEVTLKVFDIPRETLKPDRVRDPVLMYRIPSDYPGVDANGFRNPKVPGKVDIVTIGDSHTFGNNAEMNESWPYQFASLTGKTIYNLGVGGYGPLQYYYLLDKALALKPHYIFLGLYLANDLKGVCSPWLATQYWKERATQEKLDLSYCGNVANKEYGDEQNFEQKEEANPVLAWAMSTKIWLLGNETAAFLQERFRKPDPRKNLVVDQPSNKTLISLNRLRAHRDFMNPALPEIANSVKITEQLISKMAARSNEQDVKFAVLFIPSKETVYYAYLKQHGFALDQAYEDIVAYERRQKDAIRASLDQHGIPHADAETAMIKALNTQGSLYTRGNDGHPVGAGYAAYARALYDDYWKRLPPQ